jgi:hypothetical protein
VEPLVGLIDSQVRYCQRLNIVAEKLRPAADGGLHASNRLAKLARNSGTTTFTGGLTVLFGTPELVQQEFNLTEIGRLSEMGLLPIVVIDEFDSMDESTSQFRETYW